MLHLQYWPHRLCSLQQSSLFLTRVNQISLKNKFGFSLCIKTKFMLYYCEYERTSLPPLLKFHLIHLANSYSGFYTLSSFKRRTRLTLRATPCDYVNVHSYSFYESQSTSITATSNSHSLASIFIYAPWAPWYRPYRRRGCRSLKSVKSVNMHRTYQQYINRKICKQISIFLFVYMLEHNSKL
jgi:hypothetical protein